MQPTCCRWLANTFDGYVVRAHWQLDTFGHSSVTPALAALGGMDSIFFSRLDKQASQHQQLGAIGAEHVTVVLDPAADCGEVNN